MKHWLKLPLVIWQNRQRTRTLPRYLTYIVTFACNARCVMCDSWKKPAEGDLTLAEIAQIFPQLPRMDAVRLSGGEPFVRNDFAELAELTLKHLQPKLLHITTNGFLPKRVIDFCETRDKKVPLQLLISVDGMEDKHNEIRGHKNAWKMVNHTLEALAPRRKALNLSLAVNQTLTDPSSIAHYRALREHLRELKVHNQVVLAYEDSATYNSSQDTLVLAPEAGSYPLFDKSWQAEHLEELFSELRQDIATYPLAERIAKSYYLQGIANRLLHQRAHPNPPCVALNAHLRLFPDGTVPTCQFNSQPAGNLRTQSFNDLWFSEQAQRQRDWVNRCPGCWAECEVLPSALYTGDLLVKQKQPLQAAA